MGKKTFPFPSQYIKDIKKDGLVLTHESGWWKKFSYYVASASKKNNRITFSFDGEKYTITNFTENKTYSPSNDREKEIFQDCYTEMEKFFAKRGFG